MSEGKSRKGLKKEKNEETLDFSPDPPAKQGSESIKGAADNGQAGGVKGKSAGAGENTKQLSEKPESKKASEAQPEPVKPEAKESAKKKASLNADSDSKANDQSKKKEDEQPHNKANGAAQSKDKSVKNSEVKPSGIADAEPDGKGEQHANAKQSASKTEMSANTKSDDKVKKRSDVKLDGKAEKRSDAKNDGMAEKRSDAKAEGKHEPRSDFKPQSKTSSKEKGESKVLDNAVTDKPEAEPQSAAQAKDASESAAQASPASESPKPTAQAASDAASAPGDSSPPHNFRGEEVKILLVPVPPMKRLIAILMTLGCFSLLAYLALQPPITSEIGGQHTIEIREPGSYVVIFKGDVKDPYGWTPDGRFRRSLQVDLQPLFEGQGVTRITPFKDLSGTGHFSVAQFDVNAVGKYSLWSEWKSQTDKCENGQLFLEKDPVEKFFAKWVLGIIGTIALLFSIGIPLSTRAAQSTLPDSK